MRCWRIPRPSWLLPSDRAFAEVDSYSPGCSASHVPAIRTEMRFVAIGSPPSRCGVIANLNRFAMSNRLACSKPGAQTGAFKGRQREKDGDAERLTIQEIAK